MSGLAHYLEDEGVSTVVVALVREHALKMHPPRALWVPFALGRPFGTPDDSALHTRVLRAALALLDAESGPVLADFALAAPTLSEDADWVCPVSFPVPREDNPAFADRVMEEIASLRSWYDLAHERRGRTTVGLAPVPIDEGAAWLARYADGQRPGGPAQGQSEVDALRWSAEDLKSYYFEAATAQPGAVAGSRLEHWFWRETAAGQMLRALREICLRDPDPGIRDVGEFMLTPQAYQD